MGSISSKMLSRDFRVRGKGNRDIVCLTAFCGFISRRKPILTYVTFGCKTVKALGLHDTRCCHRSGYTRCFSVAVCGVVLIEAVRMSKNHWLGWILMGAGLLKLFCIAYTLPAAQEWNPYTADNGMKLTSWESRAADFPCLCLFCSCAHTQTLAQ